MIQCDYSNKNERYALAREIAGGTFDDSGDDRGERYALAREIAAQGIILLKNEDGMLRWVWRKRRCSEEHRSI